MTGGFFLFFFFRFWVYYPFKSNCIGKWAHTHTHTQIKGRETKEKERRQGNVDGWVCKWSWWTRPPVILAQVQNPAVRRLESGGS